MSTDMTIDDCVQRLSLKQESWREACADRWVRSEEAGCDVGEQAIREWVRMHWRGFVRERWIQHMQGHRLWLELPPGEFGLLKRQKRIDPRHLLDEVVELLRCGAENLDIIRWARQTKSPAEQAAIQDFLAEIDINAHRLRCSFYDG
jgi:hypothetical protein